MSKVLVTGGAGFIGSNLVDRLVFNGHDVVVIDNESSEVNDSFYWNPNATNHNVDIRNYGLIEHLFDSVETVFHLAAQSRIQPSILRPLETLSINVMGTANVLEASKNNGVKRLIYSTTSSYYGLKNPTPNVETQSEDCLNPYSLSKVTGDKLCNIYSTLFGIETISLRYFCVYGKREPLRGEFAPVIGLFLRQKRAGSSLTVVGDGKQLRDFTHVEDVIDANILAMGKEKLLSLSEVYNVGSGKSFSIIEIARMISSNVTFLPPRLAEASASLANTEKILKDFGWSPKRSLVDYISNEQNCD